MERFNDAWIQTMKKWLTITLALTVALVGALGTILSYLEITADLPYVSQVSTTIWAVIFGVGAVAAVMTRRPGD